MTDVLPQAPEINTLTADPNNHTPIDPAHHSKPDLPPTPSHIIYLGQASLDQRVGTVLLPPHVTELGHLQLAGRKETETFLKDMMILPPEIKMDVHSIKIGMDKNIS